VFPYLIDLGRHTLPLVGEVHLALPAYGVLFALGALAAGWWFIRRARGLGVPEEQLYNLVFYSLLAAIIGAKLTLVAIDWREYVEHPARLLGTLRVAGVLLGGVIAGALAFALYARRQGLAVLPLGDAVAAPLALGQAIGRLGCLAAGCCYGVATDPHNPLAIVFTNPQCQAPLGTPLVATQAIQLAFDLALAVGLAWLWRRRIEPPGTVFWVYLVGYGAGRAIIEIWRGDVERGLYFGGQVSTSQILSLIAIAIGIAMLVRGRLSRAHTAVRVGSRG
jgi:phosphatidylglycerol:prolipoprotein diacylglycerol transferase